MSATESQHQWSHLSIQFPFQGDDISADDKEQAAPMLENQVPSRKYKNKKIPDSKISDYIKLTKVKEPRKQIEKKLTVPLSSAVEDLLKRTKCKQDQVWKNNPNKARAHRHIVCGFHETLKHLLADNLKSVFVAQNIDAEMIEGPSSLHFHKLLAACITKHIPFILASTKKNISKAVNKFPYISCVGLLRNEGYETLFTSILELWKNNDQFKMFHLDQSSFFA